MMRLDRRLFGTSRRRKATAKEYDLVYCEPIIEYSTFIQRMAATTLGDYALFGGGMYITSTRWSTEINPVSTVDAYNSSLVITNVGGLSVARFGMAATTVGNHAIFAGGHSDSGAYDTVEAYSESFVRTTLDPLLLPSGTLAATTVGDYAIFAGGNEDMYTTQNKCINAVTIYNSSLVQTWCDEYGLIMHRMELAATTIGDYAIFAGGHGGIIPCAEVDVYDKNLVHSYDLELSVERRRIAAASTDKYAVFFGGERYDTDVGDFEVMGTIDAYNDSLVHTVTEAGDAFTFATAASLGGYAAFCGGFQYYDDVEGSTNYVGIIIDNELLTSNILDVDWNVVNLNSHRCGSAATAGNYMFVNGDQFSYGMNPIATEVYTDVIQAVERT